MVTEASRERGSKKLTSFHNNINAGFGSLNSSRDSLYPFFSFFSCFLSPLFPLMRTIHIIYILLSRENCN